MKRPANILLFLAFAALFTLPIGCTMKPETKAKWSATGKLVAADAAKIAFNTVISAAVSHFDGSAKADFLDSAAQGLRENMPSIVTSDNVADIVKIWTPAAEGPSHWTELAEQLAAAYAEHATPGTRQQIVEALSEGLQVTAASERQP